MIPKKLHVLWVGDESNRPDTCIETWRAAHPDWEFKIWGNKELHEDLWHNKKHMDEMKKVEWNGVADMMRWEILYTHGGFAFDADSVCLSSLPDWMLHSETFACWENELVRPGLVACGFMGAEPTNKFIYQVIKDIHATPSVIDQRAWITTGPQRMTDTWRQMQYTGLTIHPSHYFLPNHFDGINYEGNGLVFAEHFWGSTLNIYNKLKNLHHRG